jgi:flavin-dependent dehydrogenase
VEGEKIAMAQSNGKDGSRHALIVGASVAGLVAAIQFRRIGWDVDVFERSAVELAGRGAGISSVGKINVLTIDAKCTNRYMTPAIAALVT